MRPSRPPEGRAHEASRRGAGPAPAAGGTHPPGSGGREPIRPLPAYLGERPSDPTAPYYGGAAERLAAGPEKAGRVRPERAESSIQAGFRRETRPPTRAEARGLKERRTCRRNPDGGSEGFRPEGRGRSEPAGTPKGSHKK